MSDISQVERQLYILSLLSENNRGFAVDEILDNLRRVGIDVSRKTVLRDIDYITANFFVYEGERDGKTVYYASKYSAGRISFTISELAALYFTREVIRPYSGLDVGNIALKILDKLIASMPSISQKYIDSLNEMIKVNITGITPEKDINPEYLAVVGEAIADRETVFLKYYSFNSDETSQREFDPYLLEIYDGCWHVVGFCHLRSGIRDLRVSRIINMQKTGRHFNRPDNFYERYIKNRFEKLTGEEKIRMKLRFTGKAARFVKEYESARADSIKEDAAGLLFVKTTSMTPEIVKWVLGFGPEVEVLEPQELRERVIGCVREMGERYKAENTEARGQNPEAGVQEPRD